MNLFVSITLIYLIHCANYAAAVKSTVPVFLIDHEQVMAHVHVDPNPFAKMTHEKFTEIVSDSSDRSTGIVIFIEERFSVEDISIKDIIYGTPYVNLHGALTANRDTLKYFPSVIDPITVLQKAFPKTRSNVHYLARNSKLRLKDNFRHLYILFNDGADESRVDILKRHDTIIKEILAAARRLKAGPIIAYYTGKKNPVTVKKVEYVKPNTMPGKEGIFFSSPWTLLRVSESIVMYEGEETGRVQLDLQCPYNYSYYCPEPIVITNTRDGSVITLSEILVEPKGDLSSTFFNPSIHCHPYFNPTTLSVIFVVSLLLSITLYGITMISDLSANNRYEDPDGKPLVHETMH